MNQRAMETAFERSEAAFAHALERQRKLLDERINAIETQAAASVALRDLIALITDAPACKDHVAVPSRDRTTKRSGSGVKYKEN